MSRRNGDRSRFQINRKRKLRHRQRVHALLIALSKPQEGSAATSQEDDRSKKPRE
jgi:hypothetical protein